MQKFSISYERFFDCVRRQAEILEKPLFVDVYNELKAADPSEWKIEFLLDRAGIIATLERLRWSLRHAKTETEQFQAMAYELAQKGAFSEILQYVFEDMTRAEQEELFKFLRDLGYMNEGTK